MKKSYIILLLIILILFSCTKDIMTPTGEPVTLVVSPNSAILNKKGTKKFSATAYDKNNNYINVNPTWSVTGNIGEINSKGFFYVFDNVTGPFPKTGYVVATYNGITTKIPVTVELGDYWIYSEHHLSDYGFHYNQSNIQHGGWLGADNGASIGDYSDDPDNGLTCLMVTNTNPVWGGVFWLYYTNAEANPDGVDMSDYINGHLNFYIKANVDVIIKLKDMDGTETSKYLSVYGIPFDSMWYKVEIPLSELFNAVGFDESKIKMAIGFWCDIPIGKFNFFVDEIYYSPD